MKCSRKGDIFMFCRAPGRIYGYLSSRAVGVLSAVFDDVSRHTARAEYIIVSDRDASCQLIPALSLSPHWGVDNVTAQPPLVLCRTASEAGHISTAGEERTKVKESLLLL
jgi:hypothetical protein